MIQAIDPVCKMTVDTTKVQYKTDYNGTTYYFCAPGCKKAFEREPQKYLEHSEVGQEHSDHGDHQS